MITLKGLGRKIRRRLPSKGKDRDGDKNSPAQSPPFSHTHLRGRGDAERWNEDTQEQHVAPLYESLTEDTVQLDPDWINIDTLRRWLQVCDSQHGDRCRLSKIAAGYPRWLVDVERLCLVPAQKGDRYVALSYVWGQVKCVRALRDNLDELQQPGSISESNDGIIIPRTIRDAIRLTALLGEKLLWVDSLCIIQDDVESKHTQLNEMASIYANAYVTVIAANGWDANHGLRGIKGVTESRMLSADEEENIFESLQPYSTIWYSRGWTFQELIFSPRKIMFQYQMAIWECACGVWHEATRTSAMDPEVSGRLSDRAPPGFVSCTPVEIKPNVEWPDLQQYLNLVRNYNDRQLTFPEDVLEGFSGVLTILSGVFDGGFICGLPEMFFDVALLWQPEWPLERRVPSKTSRISLPSWSWAGWRGAIDTNSWESGVIQMYGSSPENNNSVFHSKTKPICQWSCGDGTTWRKVDIAHYKHLGDRLKYISKFKKLPHNWSMAVSACGRFYFSHSLMPDKKFYYPFVMDSARNLDKNNSSHLLSCRTRRLWLRVGPRLRRNHACSQRWLLTNRDEPCGIIQMNMPVEYTDKAADKAEDRLIGTACEMIAISEGSPTMLQSSRKELEYGYSQDMKDKMKEFYNVLWIEWVDGIAYRKALGKVAKAIWNKFPDEWIDVTLG